MSMVTGIAFSNMLVPWIYLLTIGVAMLTVFLSLLRPMKIAAKVSEIEAMRYQGEQTAKKSVMTICSMAITGFFFMVVATVLSCAKPSEAADNSMMGEYQLSPVIEFGNKEHPELEWSRVQKDNPLTEELKEQLVQIDGINSVECYLGNYVKGDAFDGDREGMLGVPASGKELLENGIIEGNVTYEDLMSGDKGVIDKNLLHWYPNLKIGDVLDVVTENGDETCRKQLEIAAIGDYDLGFTGYHNLIMADEGLRSFSDYNLNMYYRIFAEKKYDTEAEAALKAIVKENGRVERRTWKSYYDEWSSAMMLTRGACYAFLGILGATLIMISVIECCSIEFRCINIVLCIRGGIQNEYAELIGKHITASSRA